MRSPCHNFLKILSNQNEISRPYSGVNVVVPNTFWVHSVQGFRSWGSSKWKNFAMLFQAGFWNIESFSWIIFCWIEIDLQGLETSLFHCWNGKYLSLIKVLKLIFYDVIVMKERLWTPNLFYRISRVRKELLTSFLKRFNLRLMLMKKVLWLFYTRFEPEVWDSNPRKPCIIFRTQ